MKSEDRRNSADMENRELLLSLNPTSRRIRFGSSAQSLENYLRIAYGNLVESSQNSEHPFLSETFDRAEIQMSNISPRILFNENVVTIPDIVFNAAQGDHFPYIIEQCIWHSLATELEWESFYGASIGFSGNWVLLIGPSGCGKTTLAVALARNGGYLHGDEIALIRKSDRTLDAVARRIMVRDTVPNQCAFLDLKNFQENATKSPSRLRGIFFIQGRDEKPLFRRISPTSSALRMLRQARYGKRDLDLACDLSTLLEDAESYDLTVGTPDMTANAILDIIGTW